MKKLIVIICFAAALFMIWQITQTISSDALSMGIGVLLGVMASIPTALLLMASNKKNEVNTTSGGYGQINPYQNHSPPIVILTSGNMQQPNQLQQPNQIQQQNQDGNYNERRFYNANQIVDTQKTGEQKFKVIGDEGENW